MKQSTAAPWIYLESRPRSFYRQLFVKDSRILARTLYGWYKSAEDPLTPEEIAAEFNLPLPAIQEAIAYCETNPPEIVEDQEREDALAQALGMNEPAYKLHPTPRIISAQDLARIKRS